MVDETDIPALLPARMLNEFVYCPRLFYFEWVDRRWKSNDDTDEGAFVHRNVDHRPSVMPAPEDDQPPQTTCSVQLSNEDLGLVATIDRVDHADGWCTPVDYKKGAPQDDGQPWPADRAQILAQAALLDKAGYRVRDAVVYYASTHQRVKVPWGEEELREVSELATQARTTAQALEAPLPLVDSPKCPRCSLVTLCMPDETNALLTRSTTPPRKILPKNPDQEPLYVVEPGATVGVSGGRIQVKKSGELLSDSRLIDISHVCVYGNVQITTQALTRLWESGASVMWCSYAGWLKGWAQHHPGHYVNLRQQQIVAAYRGNTIASHMVSGKIRNQRTFLRRNSREELPLQIYQSMLDLSNRALVTRDQQSLLGLEGAAARLYFQHFPQLINKVSSFKESFTENGRSRRPPPDPINALLGFTYALLIKDLVVTCLGVGLDPYLGVYHHPRFGRPALALDLAEEFRPLIADSVVVQLINNGEINRSHFLIHPTGVQLTGEGRKKVIASYERRLSTEVTHPMFGYKISYRRVLDVQARILAAVFLGEISKYQPMVTR